MNFSSSKKNSIKKRKKKEEFFHLVKKSFHNDGDLDFLHQMLSNFTR